MNNVKQWSKAIIIMILGTLPLVLSPYYQTTWYYTMFAICSIFALLGLIALFQLIIYTFMFPYKRGILSTVIFVAFILSTLLLPYYWITYHESRPYDLLKTNFEITEARVDKTSQNGDSLSIKYHYNIAGIVYHTTKNIESNEVSDPFYIKYLPSNPEINEPAVQNNK